MPQPRFMRRQSGVAATICADRWYVRVCLFAFVFLCICVLIFIVATEIYAVIKSY